MGIQNQVILENKYGIENCTKLIVNYEENESVFDENESAIDYRVYTDNNELILESMDFYDCKINPEEFITYNIEKMLNKVDISKENGLLQYCVIKAYHSEDVEIVGEDDITLDYLDVESVDELKQCFEIVNKRIEELGISDCIEIEDGEDEFSISCLGALPTFFNIKDYSSDTCKFNYNSCFLDYDYEEEIEQSIEI